MIFKYCKYINIVTTSVYQKLSLFYNRYFGLLVDVFMDI